MTWDEIFEAYYNLYRAESDTPASTDEEYTIGLRLANEAINRWHRYDNTYWKELFNTLILADDGDKTITTSDVEYDAPSDMQEYGGSVKVIDANSKVVQRYPIIEPHEAQFRGDDSTHAYFTGDPSNDYVLHLNPAPSSALSGLRLDYVYYKEPTLFTTGSDVAEMSNPYFIVHRMLAQRFRVSRNYSAYQTAFRDAEDALKNMQLVNNSGSWANPFKLPDRSGSQFGV